MSHKGKFYIVYPERKWVDGDTIERWFMDALANNEIAADYREARDQETMAEALEDMGFITLGKPPSTG